VIQDEINVRFVVKRVRIRSSVVFAGAIYTEKRPSVLTTCFAGITANASAPKPSKP
jgi:hypothetical protein